jgi:hypothetical protein
VTRNSRTKRTGAVGQPFNNCRNRMGCVQYRPWGRSYLFN